MSLASKKGTSKRKRDISPTRSDKYYDEDGDLEVLSSDNVLFRLHAFRYQASSSVFRDMIKIGTAGLKDRIELTDPELETSAILSGLLGIMMNDEVIWVNITCDQILILKFAQKYDFANELRSIRYQLIVGLSDSGEDSGWVADEALILAWMMDEKELCAQILKTAADWTWEKGSEWNEEKRFGEAVLGGRLLDLAACPIEQLRLVPVELVWALLRASYRPHEQTKEEAKAIAKQFRRLMSLDGVPKNA